MAVWNSSLGPLDCDAETSGGPSLQPVSDSVFGTNEVYVAGRFSASEPLLVDEEDMVGGKAKGDRKKVPLG